MREPAFQFVDANPKSERERKQSIQQARAHTARVNRQKRKAQVLGQGPLPERPRPLREKSKSGSLDSDGGETVHRSEKIPWDTDQTSARVGKGGEQDEREEKISRRENAGDLHVDAFLRLPRAIAPALGAPATNTFARNVSPLDTARAAHYCLKVVWPNLLISRVSISAWFANFCQHPLAFHGFQYALAVHHDLLCDNVSWSITPRTLAHKGKTIELLNDALRDLRDENVELAILAVLVLARSELQPIIADHREPLLFDPHLPGPGWPGVYGRTGQVQPHAQAMYFLIQRQGGLPKLKTPGLADALAWSDLLSAGAELSRPAFPCFWLDSLDDVVLSSGFLQRSSDHFPGRGFICLRARLYEEALSVFIGLSRLDQVMAKCRHEKIGDREMRRLINVRNAVQYRLLCLPRWEDLDEFESTQVDRTTYECCRCVCLLYSNAVLFSVPTNNRWLSKLVGRLKRLLRESYNPSTEGAELALRIWVLVIGGIASLRSADGVFFTSSLRSVLARTNYPVPKAAVRAAVQRFLWTESACGQGFAILWDSLHIGKTCELDVEER